MGKTSNERIRDQNERHDSIRIRDIDEKCCGSTINNVLEAFEYNLKRVKGN